MKFQYVFLLFVVLMTSTIGVKNQVIASVWNPIKDVNDPHVIDIAKYAVTEQDKKAKLNLKLDKVISGETKVEVGTTYCLNISASDNIVSNKYNVVVLEKKHFRNLTSFVPLQG
ncbi:unnamed protein product [Lathyrus oleraceus]|uniref:Cystatin domain-containing protein n=1 Tax=Pisum sativum TaxID=3888 RepID=A0A9D4VIS1_PEA|nr:hypothetical protein KIW84_071175 [Pisum sativum]